MGSSRRGGAVIGRIVTTLSVLGLLASCRSAKPGDTCSKSECMTKTSGLICLGGKFVPADCKGPDGCLSAPFRCDYRNNVAGDTCAEPSAEGPRSHCSDDKKSRVRCVKGQVEREECDGPKGCVATSDTTASCDRARRAGRECSFGGDWCSTDGTEWLECRGGKLVLQATCRGPLKCRPMDSAIACDTSIGQVDDACVGRDRTCSVDGHSVLVCYDGKLRVDTACASGKTCRPGTEAACK